MSAEELSEEAKIAYQAYLDMGQSKHGYFTFLQEIDIKYKNGGAPSSEETRQLEELLKAHDKNVAAFNTAMGAINDPEARIALIKLMS